ncbi:unnamed protein product [Clonostachys rhizophaga]|jgi:hypothetical protein|uniref:NECAP PHear domain-containing protein n=2 Tax=Clonostachys TaxID=110564 RepID=A0A9N9VQS4_9HYPO|nr:unnamed protein product [Clonostachys rhizophaga]CAH0054906.1 unnamed protein product [Clonostachys solani]
MELLDPATGTPLPSDAIQRILFIAPNVHVYNIPPRPSTKGHVAAAWTTDPARQIFTARLRILETSLPLPSPSDSLASPRNAAIDTSAYNSSNLKVDVILEDPKTGALFAAAPYQSNSTVEPVLDSSRFFAVTVRDPQGRKAFLGIGFEDRSESFDFGVALQEARRGLGWEGPQALTGPAKKDDPEKDYSLKEGETITVNIGNTGIGRRRAQQEQPSNDGPVDLQSFALPPPPSSSSSMNSNKSGGFALAPPPTADEARRRKRMSAQELGFDDGKFGEFA